MRSSAPDTKLNPKLNEIPFFFLKLLSESNTVNNEWTNQISSGKAAAIGSR